MVTARQAFADNPDIQVLSSAPTWISLLLRPLLETRDLVLSFLRDHLSRDLAPDLADQLLIALEELLSNAIEHGAGLNNGKAAEPIAVSYIRTRRSINFVVRDNGPGFKLNKVSHAAINNPPGFPLRHAELRSRLGLRPGGFGILLVQQIADELIYNESGNQVIFIKYL